MTENAFSRACQVGFHEADHPPHARHTRPHSHRVVVMVVERDALFAYNIALSSPGCVPPYEPRGTDATVYYWSPGSVLSLPSISPRWIVDTFVAVLVVSSSTPHHHPFVPSSLFPSVPALSPDWK